MVSVSNIYSIKFKIPELLCSCFFHANIFSSYLFQYLNVSKNLLYAIEGIENCSTLEEFYVSFNFISDWKVLRIIKHCSLLKVCDFRENFIKNIELINTFLTYHLTNLKVLYRKIIPFQQLNQFFSDQ